MQNGSIFKTASGSWAYRYRDASGKRIQKGGYRTKGEAHSAKDEALRRTRLGGLYRPDATVQMICDQFFDLYVGDPSTVTWLEYHAKKITDAFGSTLASDLDPAAIGKWRRELTNSGSRHLTHRVFRQMLAQAVRWGWIERNAALAVSNPTPPVAELDFFRTPAAVEAVARQLGKPTDRDGGGVLLVGAGTGMRPAELFGLNCEDIDLTRGVLNVRRQYANGVLKPILKTKGSMRTIPLRASVVEAFRALDVDTRRGPVFHQSNGTRIDLHNWRARCWAPAMDAAGYGKPKSGTYLVPYAWRHTYAALSLAAGVPLYDLARHMGTSLLMIDRTYGHLTDDAHDRNRELLDAYDAKHRVPSASESAAGHVLATSPAAAGT